MRGGEQVHIGDGSAGLLVRPSRAAKQIEEDRASAVTAGNGTIITTGGGDTTTADGVNEPGEATSSPGSDVAKKPRRYYGEVELDPDRVGRYAGRIAEDVISHLGGLVGANVRVTLEIEAEIPDGAPDHVVRTVTENGRTLKFESQGFEEE